MKRDALLDIRKAWEQGYPDVPWIRGPLRIDPPRVEAGGTFQFLVDGGSGACAIIPVGRTQDDGPLQRVPETHYALSMAPDGSGIVLKVDLGWRVDHVLIEQAGEVARVARVACLWLDAKAQQWEVIYNALDRQAALLKAIADSAEGGKLSFREHLLAFLGHLIDGEAKKAIAVFEASRRLQEQRVGLQAFCERFELQLNAHGLKRTFRFWAPSEKRAYLEGTRALMESLRPLSPHVCLGFGAVLGWVRDQDLIGHDDDLDILVAFDASQVPDLGTGLEQARRILEADGHSVVGTFFSHLWVRTSAGHNADVFVGLIEKDGSLSFYPSARHSLRLPDLAPVGQATLYDVTVPVPADCEAYLARTYGTTWRRPDIGFAHPWDRSAYRDIAGERHTSPMWTRGELARRSAQAASR